MQMIQTFMPYIVLFPAMILMTAASLLPWRRTPFARLVAEWLTPVALLLTMLALLLGREQMLPDNFHTFWLTIGLSACGGGLAVLCAFLPRRLCYLPVLLLGLAGAGITAMGAIQHLDLQAAAGCGSYMLTALLGGMGLTAPPLAKKKKDSSPVASPPVGTPVETPDEIPAKTPPARTSVEPPVPTTVPLFGSLYILTGEYAGSQIQITEQEPICIGKDVTCCQLVLMLPEMPPCLCRIQWLSRKNTYLVSNYVVDGLYYANGLSLPAHGMVEVHSGSQFLFGTEKTPLFQVG